VAWGSITRAWVDAGLGGHGLGWTRAWVDVGYGEGWRGDGGDVASEIVPVRATRPQSTRRPNLSPLNQKPSTQRDPY